MKKTHTLLAATLIALCSCTQKQKSMINPLALDETRFDTIVSGKPIQLFTLQNENGMVVQITNYGGRIASLIVPDKDNNPTDVVWGFESIKDYLTADDVYAGPLVGRYGNRIAKGQFKIDDKSYQLSINNGPNHLHGGNDGFWNKIWDAAKTKNSKGEDVLTLKYLSPDGEDGYPGNLSTQVTYTLTSNNSLRIDYKATTDAPTPCNPTIHPYFNLHGTTKESINTHILQVNGSHYTPTDSVLIPTGEIATVENTVADFRKPHVIGERTSENDCDIMRYGGGGYDINYVLDRIGEGMVNAATLVEPSNGVALDIITDQPGLQFYSGSCMNGTDKGKRGDLHLRYSGLALETQHYPDSPNQQNFPSTILKPGETYHHSVEFHFYINENPTCEMATLSAPSTCAMQKIEKVQHKK